MKIWEKAMLCLAAVLMSVISSAADACAAEREKVIVEAVGFFSHFPMRPTRQTIEEICAKFGEQVSLTLYDEMQPEGQAFLSSKGLSGHIPMRLYINGVNTFTLDGREVSFSDFAGYAWTAADLENAIDFTLTNGVDGIAADTPADSGGGSPVVTAGIAAGVAIVMITGFILFRPKKKAAENA